MYQVSVFNLCLWIHYFQVADSSDIWKETHNMFAHHSKGSFGFVKDVSKLPQAATPTVVVSPFPEIVIWAQGFRCSINCKGCNPNNQFIGIMFLITGLDAISCALESKTFTLAIAGLQITECLVWDLWGNLYFWGFPLTPWHLFFIMFLTTSQVQVVPWVSPTYLQCVLNTGKCNVKHQTTLTNHTCIICMCFAFRLILLSDDTCKS